MTAVPEEMLGLKVEVIRSPRRTAALHIVGSDLQVCVPKDLGEERVAAILQQKRPWIVTKVAELKRMPPQKTKELVSGESFPYLGRHYRLKVQDGHQVGVRLSGGTSWQLFAPPSRETSASSESSSIWTLGTSPEH